MRTRKKTARSKSMTMFAETLVIASTSRDEAMTKKEITNATIALRFFFGYVSPPIFSVPRTFVFSKMAKTMVKVRRKGKTTS